MYPNLGTGSGSSVTSAKYILGPTQNTFQEDTLSAAETSRDTYASENSSWLTEYTDNNYYIILIYNDSNGDKYAVTQFYYTDSDGNSEWVELNSFVGVSGDDAPDVEIQYSTTGTTWHTDYVDGSDYYIRFSTDGGSTYGDSCKFIADEVESQYSVDGDSDWHSSYVEGSDYYIRLSTDGGTTYSDAIKIAAYSIKIQYSVDGTTWHSTRTSSDSLWRWSTDNGGSWSSSANFSSNGTGFPSPYTAVINSDGQLEVADGNDIVCMQLDEDGLWVKAVTTSTGSIHIGEIFSIGSGYDQVSFFSDTEDEAHFLSWGALAIDGSSVTTIQDRFHGDSEIILDNGAVDTNYIVDYNVTTTVSRNLCFFNITIYVAEDYSGDIDYTALNGDGVEVMYKKFTDVSYITGHAYQLGFSYPSWLPSGTEITVTAIKDDGTYLQVYAGATNSEVPYRSATVREYTDYDAYNAGNIADLLTNINENFADSDGGIDYDVINNVPIATDSSLGIAQADGETISVTSGIMSVDPSYIDITDLKNASAYLTGALKGDFDEDVTESYFTYDTDGVTYITQGSWYIFAPTSNADTVSLGTQEMAAGDILLCVTTVDTTITSSNFDDYYKVIVNSENLATTSVAGAIVLAGDLGGVGTAPTVENCDGANVKYTDTSTTTKYYFEITDGEAYLVEV